MKLSASSIRLFLKCPRCWYLKYQVGIRPLVEDDERRTGTAYHRMHELRGKGMAPTDAVGIVLGENAPAGHDTALRKAAALFLGHCAVYPEPLDASAEYELDFEIPLGRHTAIGRIDRLVLDSTDNGASVLDYKTTAQSLEATSQYWDTLRFDWQTRLYALAAAQLKGRCAKVVYDVARKPGIRPRMTDRKTKALETPVEYMQRLMNTLAEDPDNYYVRREVPVLESDLRETQREFAAIGDAIQHCIDTGGWYRNSLVESYGGHGDLAPVCLSDSPDGGSLPLGFQRKSSAKKGE